MTEIGKIVNNAEVKEFINRYNNKKKQRPNEFNADLTENIARMKDQTRREEEIMNQKPPCSLAVLKSLKINIADLKTTRLVELINKQFYDPMIMKAIMCLTETIFFSDDTNETIRYNERIKDWLQDLKQIGEPSVEGVALRASIKGSKKNVMESNIFIIKAPQDPNNSDLLHEMFVGFQLNKLRGQIPNFAYIFGGFKCSPPIIDAETKKVIAWCENTKNVVNYVAYENVQPSVPMSNYVKKSTFEQFCNRLLQVCYCTDFAYQKIDYTHYDLHDGNVLDRKTEFSRFYIPYFTDNDKIEYLLTDGIATVIDYGITHVKYEGIGYGDYLRQDFQVFPDRSFPISDLYKFLLFCMRSMFHSKNDDCFNKCRALLAFFNNVETAEDVLAQQDEAHFYMPYNDKTKNISVMDFAKYIRIVMEEFGVKNFIHERPEEGIDILGCGDQFSKKMCYTNVGIINDLGVNKFDFTVKDVIEFVASYQGIEKSTMTSEMKGESLQKLIDNFEYNKQVNDGMNKLREGVEEMKNLTNGIKVMDISGMNLNQLLMDENITLAYRKYTTEMLTIQDLLNRKDLLIKTIEFIMNLYQDQNGLEELRKMDAEFTPYAEFYNYYLPIIFAESGRIQEEVVRNWNMFQNAVNKNKTFDFWYHGLQSFDRSVQ